jgi:capsular polysaccharide biosynthesis protein
MTPNHTFQRTYEVIRGGFATAQSINWSASPPRDMSGCVYRADGTKVALSERFDAGHQGEQVVSKNPPTTRFPKDADFLPGRGVYLGHEMVGHYGHFVFEGLSTFWVFEEFDPSDFDYFLFHTMLSPPELPEYARYCYDKLNININKIVRVGNQPLAFEELVIPERLARINHSMDARLRSVFERIARTAERAEPLAPRIFISRRKFNQKQFDRNVANEVHVEALFKRAGFHVIYPETLTYPQQLAFCANAEVFAGTSGSNLFSIAFAKKGTVVIELADPRYEGGSNPCLGPLYNITDARAHLVKFRGRIFGPRLTILVDIRSIADDLQHILRKEFPDENPAPLGPPSLTPIELLEVGYQCVRPTVGHQIRVVMGKIRHS